MHLDAHTHARHSPEAADKDGRDTGGEPDVLSASLRLLLVSATHTRLVTASLAAELTPRYVTAGSGALIKIWSLDTHALLGQLRGHTEPVGQHHQQLRTQPR